MKEYKITKGGQSTVLNRYEVLDFLLKELGYEVERVKPERIYTVMEFIPRFRETIAKYRQLDKPVRLTEWIQTAQEIMDDAGSNKQFEFLFDANELGARLKTTYKYSMMD